MATRGTIQFRTSKEQGSKNLGYVYVHHDMYTQGFRDYLVEVFQNNTVHAHNLMTKFLKVIERSEVTVSHKYHGDTEFRYEIFGSKEDNGEILIYQRDYEAEDENPRFKFPRFKLSKAMKIKDFMNNPEI